MPIIRRLLRQVSCPQHGRVGGVCMRGVAFGELQDDRFGRHALEGLFLKVHGIRYRVGSARHPLRCSKNCWMAMAPATALMTGD